MNKVQANLIKVNLKAGNKKLAVFIALQASKEGCMTEFNNGNVGYSVYLDNAFDLVKGSISRHEFAGYLSALAADGNYKQYDEQGHFGQVILKAAANK